MQLDPYMHLQLREQEIRRQMILNAREREAREAKAQLATASDGRPRVAARPSRRTVLVGALVAITRAIGFGRQAI